MACALTQGFTLDCRDSRGGSKEFYIMPWDDLATTTVLAGEITVLTKDVGKNFWKYMQEVGTCEAEETLVASRENGSVFYEQSVKLVLNKRAKAVRNEILLLAQNRVVIVEVDRNGNAWFYGFDNGLFLEAGSAKSGRAMGDRNGYELEFKGQEDELAYSVLSSVVTALTTVQV
jgi:hypothetical protein